MSVMSEPFVSPEVGTAATQDVLVSVEPPPLRLYDRVAQLPPQTQLVEDVTRGRAHRPLQAHFLLGAIHFLRPIHGLPSLVVLCVVVVFSQ